MTAGWNEAKECAKRGGFGYVYHDCDTGTYGACARDERQGEFRQGVFHEHRCICMPASLSEEELEGKERKFRAEHPEW